MKIKTVFDQMDGSDQVPELKLNFRRSLLSKDRLDSTDALVGFLRKVFDPDTFYFQEEMILLILDDNMRPICFYRLAKGTKGAVSLDFRILLKVPLCCSAERFILAHNHPDGYAFPSMADLELTNTTQLKSAWFGIDFLDHIVLSKLEEESEDDDPGFYSMADNGYLVDL